MLLSEGDTSPALLLSKWLNHLQDLGFSSEDEDRDDVFSKNAVELATNPSKIEDTGM
tara:strand:- start:40 stop:210 length:171 start_codon:yes stop_codon:yes gene_type:complete